MSLYKIEEKDDSLPILCIVGDNPLLLEDFIKQTEAKFRIIFVSQKKPAITKELANSYFIPYDKAELLPKLAETISYTLIFADPKNEKVLPYVLVKMQKDRAKMLALVSIEEGKTCEFIINRMRDYPHLKVAIIGELLTRKKGEVKGELSKIIDNAITKREIRVNGELVVPVYGITLKDTLSGIGRLLFGNAKSGVVYNLFYQHPQTLLEAAHIISRVEEVNILFNSDPHTSTLPQRASYIKRVESYGFENAYSDTFFYGFEKGVEDLWNQKKEEAPVIKTARRKRFRLKRHELPSSVRFVLLSLVLGSILFVFVNLLFAGLGLFYLKSAVRNLESNNFTNASQDARYSHFFLSSIRPTIELSFQLVDIFDKNRSIQKTYLVALRGRELTEIAGLTVSSLLTNPKITEGSISQSLANLAFLYQEGQRIALTTSNTKLSQELKTTYAKLLSFSEVLPAILGFDGEKQYLLLFQNDEELRPTGGFIGSIGELKVKEGKIIQLAIQDVYELDGQLRNHIEPPFIVRRTLQPHLFLRDSNFYLNFQEVASTAAKIYNLETGKRPDAVIAINLRVLKEILKISGPITLPNYNVTVTNDTVSNFIQNTIKDNFFPGSTQKKDVLNSVFAQLVEKSQNDTSFNIKVLKRLPDLLEERDIQVSFRENAIQKIFSANDYAGELSDQRTPNSKAIQDFLYINEANIGVNKVNSAVSREVEYHAMIGDGALLSKAKVTLTNNSPQDNYTVYITLVAPAGSVMQGIKINGTKQSLVSAVTDPVVYEDSNFIKPEGLEVEQYGKDGRTHFAFTTTAKIGEKTTIEIEYTNGAFKPLTGLSHYSLLYVKQPGTNPYPVKTIFTYPEGYTPTKSREDNYGKNFMESTMQTSKDFIKEFKLQKDN